MFDRAIPLFQDTLKLRIAKLGPDHPDTLKSMAHLAADYQAVGKMDLALPLLEAMVQETTGVKVLALHHDISTVTGEEVVLFTLSESPLFRQAKKK